MTKRITRVKLAKWCLGAVIITYLNLALFGYLFTTVGKVEFGEVYTMFLICAAVMLLAMAAGFYAGLKKCVSTGIQPTARPEVGRRLQRIAVMSMLASLQIIFVIGGVLALRKGLYTAEYIFLAMALAIAILQFLVLRHYRNLGNQAASTRRDNSFKNILVYSFLLAIVAAFFIAGKVSLQFSEQRIAVLFFGVGLALGVIGLTVAVKHVRAREASLPQEERVFDMAMTLYWLSVLVVTSFFAGCVLLIGYSRIAYAFAAFLACAASLWAFLRSCEKAAARLQPIGSSQG